MNIEKALNSYEPVTESGCWIWMRGRSGNGYGMIVSNGAWIGAHRFFYEWRFGKIPEGLEIDHLCRVRCCVNPNHLEAVPKSVNISRGMWPSAVNARRTHCEQGHAFDVANTLTYDGNRRCAQCFLDWRIKNRDRINAGRRRRRSEAKG